ncbi:hypothetical protein [Bacillus sp. REN10]|uniref:hypothetical protein n=1 Tax=Bacillus sp. REN10 TaxID=2782541 RepID=UPI00193C6148|nr:hypothetical protein [Bacillus sp. REN10]
MNVMTRAWEIAKAAVVKFGGKVKEYFAESLKLAWKEVKNAVANLVELKGSDKQIAWANDIRDIFISHLPAIRTLITEYEKQENAKLKSSQNLKDLLVHLEEKENRAGVWINAFKSVTDKYETGSTLYKIVNSFDNLRGTEGLEEFKRYSRAANTVLAMIED